MSFLIQNTRFYMFCDIKKPNMQKLFRFLDLFSLQILYIVIIWVQFSYFQHPSLKISFVERWKTFSTTKLLYPYAVLPDLYSINPT